MFVMSSRLSIALGPLLFLAGNALAATAPDGVLDRLDRGQAVDLIVEFKANAVDREAASLRSKEGRHFDGKDILAMRAGRYADLRASVAAALATQPIDTLRDYRHLPMGFRRFRSAAALNAFLARPEVAAVYEDTRMYPVLAQSLPLIGQPMVAAAGEQGAGTTVAIIDTGVDYTNAAFGSCTAPGLPGSCHVVVSQLAGSATGASDNSHGTNVSAVVLGVAPGTRIAMLDAFSGTSASSADIISAIDWAISNQAAYNIVAINMSLGDGVKYTAACKTGNPYLTPIANAATAGISVAVASGNNAYTNGITSPACTPGAIAVGAVYDADLGSASYSGLCSDSTTAADRVTCFSNSSSLLTMLAPGAAITAAGITMYGTSQATPHVAGAIAVLRAAFPDETLTQTKYRLTSAGVAITDPRNSISKPRLDLLGAARPANDAFANRASISGSSGSATGTSLLATEEAGEPAHGGSGGAHSVWWTWTAPASGQVTLDTAGSGFDTLLAVYTGTAVGALTGIARNDNAGGSVVTSSLLFQAQAGTQYQIAVDGASGAAGTATLNWSLDTAAKANLSVAITGAGTGITGAQATYALTAANAGPQSATNVVVTLTLPANASFVSGAGCTANGSQVSCDAGTLANGGGAHFDIVIAWTGAEVATLTATVASDVPDPGAGDNTAAFAVAVANDADVPALPAWAALLGTLLFGCAVGGPLGRDSQRLSDALHIGATRRR
jgi:uncharacterized repeat protein (TIGR01451 family)